MEAKDAIVAGALLNAELMIQRDEALAQVQQLAKRVEELEAEREQLAGAQVPDKLPDVGPRVP